MSPDEVEEVAKELADRYFGAADTFINDLADNGVDFSNVDAEWVAERLNGFITNIRRIATDEFKATIDERISMLEDEDES